ncbi:MAG TPA: CocE/NonD family hydrolase [Candidatus Thermoplasmatota archaeon]|nr:CocE/NonD family hydrolase [Candidatus Thermoplasmatota archaeon]
MRTLLLAFSVVLLAPALAGCLDGGDDGATTQTRLPPVETLSAKVFAILPPEEVWVTTSAAFTPGESGIRLHNAVYRPDSDGPVPVFINFSPYWDDSATAEGDAFSQYMIHEYVPRGFAVVLSAVRGTGHSEGCFEVASDRESLDVNEVVDHFANEPWSNGHVAAGGKSYDATTQNGMIAKFPHPALKGIFHVSGITDMYSYTFAKGTPARADSAVFTTTYGVGQGLSEYVGGAAGAGGPDDDSPESLARLAGEGCTATPMGAGNAGASTVAGAKTPYWVERDWTRSIASSEWNGSIFFVHGLQDWNVQPSHIQPWIDEVHKNGGIRVLGWLHQWAAQDEFKCEPGNGHVYPMRSDWNETMLRWLDAILKDKDTGLDALYGFDVMDTQCRWRHDDVWPPAETVIMQAATGQALALPAGPVRVSGVVRVDVPATSANPDPVLTAVLYDEGGAERTWVGEAVLRGVFRESLEAPSAVPPGAAVTYRLETYPLDHVVEAGHRLVVEYGAAPDKSVALPSQLAGVTYGTGTLVLPVGDLGLIEPQPQWMKCFAC